MQSSMGADVEAVWRLFMAWSSPGNDHQAQILHCACNLSPLQRNLPAKPGWHLAAQSAAPCVAASCRALVCATSCESRSEERRVGNEVVSTCRSWRWTYNYNINKN